MQTQARFRTQVITSWEEFRILADGPEYRSWAFRGQAKAEWNIYSSLSRYFTTFGVHKDAWPQQEHRILRIFQRKAHLRLDRPPEEEDLFQWLALMQHHGAPTRLIDFTWSPYVAAFFALERAEDDSAVWALCPPMLSDTPIRTIRPNQRIEIDEVAPWVKGCYEADFLPNNKRIVVVGEPVLMNRRLVAQSGTFVTPGLLDEPVEALARPNSIVKIVLSTRQMRKQAMAALYSMNIGNATLFPELDGLARSLAYELEFHWAFDPTTMETQPGYSVD